MEDTRGNLQNSRNELKSVGREDDSPHFSATNHIFSGDNYQTNTVIEYENDETLKIKQEIIPAQQRCQSGDHNLLPNKKHLDKKSISFHNNSDGRTLIEYKNDETLEIKEEISRDEEIHQSGDHNLLSVKNHLDEKPVFCDNISGWRTLIEYDNDETLETEEEIVQDPENAGETFNKKYELKLCTVNIRADDILAAKTLQCTLMKEKMQESKQDKEKKSKASQPRHNSANLSSYTTKGRLIKHKRLGHAAVKPQFICDACGYETDRKYNLSTHIFSRHFKKSTTSQSRPQFICDVCGYKTNFKSNLSRHNSAYHFEKSMTSQTRHNCGKCSLGYRWLSDLKRHDCLKHAATKPQFICDACGYKANLKYHLSRHISVRHLKKSKTSQARYNCDKCSRRYNWLCDLKRHARLKHSNE